MEIRCSRPVLYASLAALHPSLTEVRRTFIPDYCSNAAVCSRPIEVYYSLISAKVTMATLNESLVSLNESTVTDRESRAAV